MKKVFLSAISILIVCVMLIGAFSACAPKNEEQTSDTSSDALTDATTQDGGESNSSNTSEPESATESENESDTDTDNTDVSLSGEHADIIEHANDLANGVTAYFTDAGRKYHSIQNREMTVTYARSIESDQRVASIKNTKGKTYIEDTMDVFIRMKGGSQFYASQSPSDAKVNIFRFGYYYYQGFYSGQTFIPKSYQAEMTDIESLNLKRTFNKKADGVKLSITDYLEGVIANDNDPKFFTNTLGISTAKHNVLRITIKATGDTNRMQAYFNFGSGFGEGNSKWINLITDGEFHTYTVSLFDLYSFSEDENAKITQIRLDPTGSVDSGFIIKDITLGKSEVSNYPQFVQINRQFHVYSDKMHHEIQVNVSEITEDVEAIGVRTEIAKDTVDKILIVDKNEKTYTSLTGIDWTTVTAVAFDIKEAGIFGYIMPYDGKGGVISVSEEDGKYVIIREITPPDNTLTPSLEGSRNLDDFYTGCRVYTDENHDFEEFLYENMCEQNPLVLGKNVKVSEVNSDSGEFAGYDSLRGIYVFNVNSPTGHFWTPYNNPNKNYKVNFTISCDNVDRDIYLMSSATNGLLECAAFFDDQMMMLPMPIEVIKNFVDSKNNFNVDDYKFSEAILPLSLTAGQRKEYTLVNLYQLWGKFPLKQISQIPFHLPYYHLSTGVTETNCITPWFATTATVKSPSMLSTLPDHRAWSAPMWSTEPQHTNSGSHHWLEYTDSNGQFVSVENTYNTITSFGPTYAEVIMDHISDDGKIKVTYTHMEMPQTDENRAYYTMEYTVLEDVSIKDFKKNFQFFSIQTNDSTGEYQSVSYLDENNKSAYVKNNTDAKAELEYKLGDLYPYFTMYDIPGKYDAKTNPHGYSGNGYSNLSFLVYNSEFILSGEEYEPEFVIINSQYKVRLSLDLGDVTLKAGDKFTINAIVTPWGSQNSVYDGSNGFAPDQNIIDLRENTCIDPLKVTSETDEIIDSTFLPKIKSKNGKTAEFTLSGCKNKNGAALVGGSNVEGRNNVAVRVYGFDMLTAPKVEEFVNGEWVEYVVSSKDTPDVNGYYHYYDGYCVYYDGDGTYSYSFVVDMTEGEDRKFRISADKEFEGWPAEVAPDSNNDLLSVYLDAQELKALFKNTEVTLSDDLSYMTAKVKPGAEEIYSTIHNATDGSVESGQYIVIKYRIPTTNTEKIEKLEFYLSTLNREAKEGDNVSFAPVADGEWHVFVIDVSKSSTHKSFAAAADKYFTKYIRFDLFNRKYSDASTSIDIGFVGMDSDLRAICDLVMEDFETITLIENATQSNVDTLSGEKIVEKEIVYVHPDSDYTKAENILYSSVIDTISNVLYQTYISSPQNIVKTLKDVTLNDKLEAVFAGWCVVDGGVSKYVWSVDGGKTWFDFKGNDTLTTPGTDIMNVATNRVGGAFTAAEGTGNNGRFQENGNLIADLSEFSGKTVDFIFAAVPTKDTSTLIPLYCIEDLVCEKPKPVHNSDFAEDSQYKQSYASFGAYIDSLGDDDQPLSSGTLTGLLEYHSEIYVGEYYYITIKGWAVVDGGVSKYIWTADGGKTWHDCEGNATEANPDILKAGKSRGGSFNYSDDINKKNGSFQNDNAISLDLIDYENSTEPLQIMVCAVNDTAPSTATIIFKFTNVTTVKSE